MGAFAPQLDSNKAWVVFTNDTDLPLLRVFKRGYRHCFIVLYNGKQWVTIDPLSNRAHIEVLNHLADDFNYPVWLKNKGFTVVPTKIIKDTPKHAIVALLTCVSLVKRVLGLHNPFIQTPYQLHNYLVKEI